MVLAHEECQFEDHSKKDLLSLADMSYSIFLSKPMLVLNLNYHGWTFMTVKVLCESLCVNG